MRNILLLSLALVGVGHVSYAETLIPRSVGGDKGKYFLLETKRTGNIVTAVRP